MFCAAGKLTSIPRTIRVQQLPVTGTDIRSQKHRASTISQQTERGGVRLWNSPCPLHLVVNPRSCVLGAIRLNDARACVQGQCAQETREANAIEKQQKGAPDCNP